MITRRNACWGLGSLPFFGVAMAYADPTGTNALQNKLPQSTVSSLPACATATMGVQYLVTDANATSFHSIAAGGGATAIVVTCNGANWLLGG